jgi:guanylate kinase
MPLYNDTLLLCLPCSKLPYTAFSRSNYTAPLNIISFSVSQVRSAGKICILDIDVQGVRNVKKSSLQCKYVFILPPSIEELEARLRGRGTETEEKIQIRMKTAHEEIAFGNEEGNFDALVTNTDLEVAFAELVGLLKKWYPEVDFDAYSLKPENTEPAEEK